MSSSPETAGVIAVARRFHETRRNPRGLRWRLILWLTGGTIEAVPLLGSEPIDFREGMIVRLGQPGALNTVEVLDSGPYADWSNHA